MAWGSGEWRFAQSLRGNLPDGVGQIRSQVVFFLRMDLVYGKSCEVRNYGFAGFGDSCVLSEGSGGVVTAC